MFSNVHILRVVQRCDEHAYLLVAIFLRAHSRHRCCYYLAPRNTSIDCQTFRVLTVQKVCIHQTVKLGLDQDKQN